MNQFRIKYSVLILLSTLFLAYSFKLYFSNYNKPSSSQSTIDVNAIRGKLVWQQKNCQACHQIYGLGGHLGPDLTNVYGHRSEAYIRAFLTSGTNVMPNFHLSNQEMDELVAFLKYVNTTGISDPKSYSINSDGTIRQH